MSKQLATTNNQPTAIELALIAGDLSKLSAEQRLGYYQQTCESLGLNPLTQPFKYINLNGKLTLYATKDCTEQLRDIKKVSVKSLEKQVFEGVYVVTATGQDGQGRVDTATGAVTITGLKGDALANAMMKAETKAKRRLTLSICGLGLLDETEVETIQDAKVDIVEVKTGEIKVLDTLKTADEISSNGHHRPDVSMAQVMDKRELNDEVDEVLKFGKYKGSKWSELPEDYLNWMVQNAKDARFSSRALAELERRATYSEDPFNGDNIPEEWEAA